jgi:uncharacterized protein
MTLRLIKLLFISTIFIVFLAKPAYAVDPLGFVNDFADVLSPEFELALEEKLASFSAQQGPEIAVVTIESLEGNTVENYAVELFSDWGIGKKDQDNGVLFLAAISDRKMRLEVGYGVEDKLNDAKAGRIIRNTIAPEFKNQDYEAGIEKGTNEIIASLEAEEVDEVLTTSKESSFPSIIPFIVFAAIFTYLAAFLARSKSWWAGGIIGFIIGLFSSFWIALMLAGIGLLLDYILSSNFKKLKKAKKSTGFWSTKGGFWTGGKSSGGGFGGFSGGSSGGGGASGSW